MIRAGFLDIETTGLKQAEGHRIIEVALKIYNLEDRSVIGSFVSRINALRGIDPKAQAVHGISFEELADEPLWEAVAPKLSKLMGHCNYMVAHNGEGFDIPFILHEFIRVGVSVPEVALVDTMLQARWATPDGAVPNLRALAFACGVPYDSSKAHAALYDVEVMAECFFAQYDRGFFKLPTSKFELKKEKP